MTESDPRDALQIRTSSLACRFAAAYLGRDSVRMAVIFTHVHMEQLWEPFAISLADLITSEVVDHDAAEPAQAIDSLMAYAVNWERFGGDGR
jgi:hypothetical protein